MDTRQKILDVHGLDALLRRGAWVIAVGLFDPLTAAQAKRLSALNTLGGKLLVIVLDSNNSLLPGAARAAMVAALRDVDAVTVAESKSWRSAIPGEAQVRIVEDSQAEEGRSADFVRFIVERQATALNGKQRQ